MKYNSIIVGLLFTSLAFSQIKNDQAGQSGSLKGNRPQIAAQKALNEIQNSLDHSTLHSLGLNSLDEGRNIKLGEGIDNYELYCNAIAEIDQVTEVDPKKMPSTREVFFPVKSGGRNRFLVLVSNTGQSETQGAIGDWQPVLIGATSYLEQLELAISRLPKNAHSSFAIVQSPALGAVFLNYEEEKHNFLLPVQLKGISKDCFPSMDYKIALPAGKVLGQLSKCFDKNKVCSPFQE